jgi:hypothetical protein
MSKLIVGVYGIPGFPGEGDVLSKQAAEKFAEQLKGKTIDNPENRSSLEKLIVVSASLEGDERQGKIVAECVEVQDNVTISDTLR